MFERRDILIGGGAAVAVAAIAGWSVSRNMGTMEDYNLAMAALRSPLPQSPSHSDLIRFATLAANSHNTQAWRFKAGKGSIDILPDLTRRAPAVDPDNHHLFASLGCAGENLAVAAGARGLPGELIFDPAQGGAVRFNFVTGTSKDTALCDAIALRQSTRAEYDGSEISAAELETLARTATMPGVDLVLITERARINRLSDLILEGNTAQIADSAFVAELKHWLRFNPQSAIASGDGLFSAASGNPNLPDWLGPRIFDLAFKTKSENEKYARQVASSTGMAVFVAAKADPEHWVLAGRACQRFALQATAMGLKHAYLNQPVEVPELRGELAALAGMPGRRPDLVMRFGRGAAMPFSARRSVKAVMV